MKHVHFVIKHKQQPKNGNSRKKAFNNYDGYEMPTRKKKIIAPPGYAFDVHSNPVLVKVDKEQNRNFYFPAGYESRSRRRHACSKGSRCPTCGSTKHHREGRRIANPNKIRLKVYQVPRDNQSHKKSKEQRNKELSIRCDMKKKNRRKFQDHETIPYHIHNPKVQDPDSRRSRRKVKKLYENESLLKPEYGKHAVSSVRKRNSNKEVQHNLKCNPRGSPNYQKDLENYRIEEKPRRESGEYFIKKHKRMERRSNTESVKQNEMSREEKNKNCSLLYVKEEEGKNSNDFQADSQMFLKESSGQMTSETKFDLLKPESIKDSLEIMQKNKRNQKSHKHSHCNTKNNTEAVKIERPDKTSLKSKDICERNKREKKIAFADTQSYRTFRSHEPPSKIGATKTENVAQEIEQSGSTISFVDQKSGNITTNGESRIINHKGNLWVHNSSSTTDVYDAAVHSSSSLLSAKSPLNSQDTMLIQEICQENDNLKHSSDSLELICSHCNLDQETHNEDNCMEPARTSLSSSLNPTMNFEKYTNNNNNNNNDDDSNHDSADDIWTKEANYNITEKGTQVQDKYNEIPRTFKYHNAGKFRRPHNTWLGSRDTVPIGDCYWPRRNWQRYYQSKEHNLSLEKNSILSNTNTIHQRSKYLPVRRPISHQFGCKYNSGINNFSLTKPHYPGSIPRILINTNEGNVVTTNRNFGKFNNYQYKPFSYKKLYQS
ncbi:hypothetical protein M8J77_016148 [Diaphorina citri]|nr:hypothetical protein M8J77_016148 [Diaphorina citri]